MATILGDATLFPMAPDGGQPIRLARAWATAISSAASGKEVRAAIRSVPVRRLEYTPSFITAAEAGQFRALWLGAVERLRYTVPVWPMASTPSAFPSSTEITTDTVGRDFVIGGSALLWNSETDYEIIDIDDLDDVSIATVLPVDGAFVPGYTVVVPLMNAWLDPPTVDQRMQRAELVPLVFREELPAVAGIDPDVGGAITPVAASLSVVQIKAGSPWAGQRFDDRAVFVFDAAGQRIMDPPLTWTVTPHGITLPDPIVTLTYPHRGQEIHFDYVGDADVNFDVLVESGSASASFHVGG